MVHHATVCRMPCRADRSDLRAIWIVVGALALACASGSERFDARAAARGLERSEVAGAAFRHAVYANAARGGRLHVYLAGDGEPWRFGRIPADDPTIGDTLALRLLALDPAPALYLGRPCYHGHVRDPGCDPWYWTHGRYGERVVASLAAALARLRRARGDPELWLIGHSGGGALALLLAARAPGVRGVVTIAGNLDPARWASLHGYAALEDSLDPAALPRLAIRQVHLAGGRDENVPPALIERVARRQGAAFEVHAEFDHRCCWERLWPGLLDRLVSNLGRPVPFCGSPPPEAVTQGGPP
jgi:pimeloyl-ACP methyl ester carboxylesterase